ncbi:hypothetical protein NM688_g7707 [Phlebia brevispora]|uniref:Uncharacterized protein n=1 Tax=Phlebia brevispora TaxID=194682 RepID=A0ACC1S1Y0_9APHY|nr:hypothetical protein NM688_g7707 [Phlebia brevispora]
MSDPRLASVQDWFRSLGKKFRRRPRDSVGYGGEMVEYEPSAEEEPAVWNQESLGHLDCRYARSDPSASTPKYIDQNVVRKVTASLTLRHNMWREWYDRRASNISPQRIVIYSDEELRENANLDIPLQVKHATTGPAISFSLASESCERLGVGELLSNFNELLGTSFSVETPGLRQVLEQCIERRYDFGTAFGRLRTFWVDYTRWKFSVIENEETKKIV